jgi:pyrimidine operon attenuation protein / uracil phosphoribosyltransferase
LSASEPSQRAVQRAVLMDADDVQRTLARMAREVVERAGGTSSLAFMGIRRRGVELADRLRQRVEADEALEIPWGILDITLYRDDLQEVARLPLVGQSQLPAGGVDGRIVVLVDDVVHTGRTIRAALNELMDWGRPARILLCALVERRGRELPIQPDIVGHHVEILPGQRVEVLVPEEDGRLAVEIASADSPAHLLAGRSGSELGSGSEFGSRSRAEPRSDPAQEARDDAQGAGR